MANTRPSIRDVARESGVSPTTVSLIINQVDKRISAATRTRVLTTIDRLQYKPSRLAQGLPSMSSKTLAIILPDLHMAFADAYFGEIISGIYDHAAEQDYRITLEVARRSFVRSRRYLAILDDCSVDGLLFLGAAEEHRWLEECSGSDRPLLIVNNRFPQWDLDSILCDYPAAARLAADHLFALGHRKIGMVCGPSSKVYTADELTNAFIDRLAEHGVAIRDRLIVDGEFNVQPGQRAAAQVLATDPNITAIFCGNDKMALGAYQAARAMGRHVGGDLSIIGCDDLPAAATADPPMTTVRLNYYDLGVAACARMLRRLGLAKSHSAKNGTGTISGARNGTGTISAPTSTSTNSGANGASAKPPTGDAIAASDGANTASVSAPATAPRHVLPPAGRIPVRLVERQSVVSLNA